MGQREKLTFVYDADGSIGVVMEFSESDFEAYSMPDLALVGAFQTKAQAAQALGDLLLNSSQRPAALGGASAISAPASLDVLGGYVAHRSDAKTFAVDRNLVLRTVGQAALGCAERS